MSEVQDRDMKLEFEDFICRLHRMAGLVRIINDKLCGMDHGIGGGKRNAALDEVELLTGIAEDGLKELVDTVDRSSVVVLSSGWRAEKN
jgi:hypothetical protein